MVVASVIGLGVCIIAGKVFHTKFVLKLYSPGRKVDYEKEENEKKEN